MEVLLYYDEITGKVIMTASGVDGLEVSPGYEHGKTWADGVVYKQENIQQWRIGANTLNELGGPDLFHKQHRFMYVVEEDGKPVGVRPPDDIELNVIQEREKLNRSKSTVLSLASRRREILDCIDMGVSAAAFSAELEQIDYDMSEANKSFQESE